MLDQADDDRQKRKRDNRKVMAWVVLVLAAVWMFGLLALVLFLLSLPPVSPL